MAYAHSRIQQYECCVVFGQAMEVVGEHEKFEVIFRYKY